MRQTSETHQRAIIQRLDKFSRFTDSSIRLPFTRFSVGFEAIIGLVPVLGDVVGLGMAGYVLWEARRAGVSTDITQHMLRNVAIDFVGGLLPVVGDAFDAIFKANTRNTRLLKNYLEEQLSIEPPPPAFPWTLLIGLSFVFAVLVGAFVLILK